MRRLFLVVALYSIGCGSSPTAPAQPSPTPQPPPAASFTTTGQLLAANCVFNGSTFTCDFSASATNIGTGCAANVRGKTTTFRPKPFETVLNFATWTYGSPVKANESFTYRGNGIQIPQEAGWTYATEFQWDNVACS
jgi:hypothetical protein